MGKGALTRERILDEAMRLASRDGLQGLSIGGLATALSLSKSGLFAHFGSKEALQIAVLQHTGARFLARVKTAVEALPPGPGRLRALLEGQMDWIDDPELPGGCPIMAACFELDDQEGGAREFLVERQQGMIGWIRDLFGDFAAPGSDLDQLAFEYRAISMAYHHAARVLRDPLARDRSRRACEALLRRAQHPRD